MNKNIKIKTARRWLNKNKWMIAKAKINGWKKTLKAISQYRSIANE